MRSSYLYSFIFTYVIVDVITVTSDTYYAEANVNSEALMMIRNAGYPAESHRVITQDGYILEMHRIPGRRGSVPVFLQHELFGCSNLWLLSGKNGSLAFFLANEGYDVWIGNVRGTTYGKAHMSLSPNDPKFWTYSQHELGVYDLSAEISYVTNLTSQSVVLIAFSMGCPISLIMTAEQLNMHSKIRLMIHLAPAVFMNNMKHTVLKSMSLVANEVKMLADLIGIGEIPPSPYLVRLLIKYFCTFNELQEKLCREIIMALFGFNTAQFSLPMVSALLHYAPDTTSTMVLNHYAQWIQSGHFRQYDYGGKKNLQIYNQITPPDYDISRINIPNVVFYAENDLFADIEDVFKLYDQLPIKAGIIRVDNTDFSHLDFRIATDNPSLLFNHIVTIMNDYSYNTI